MDLLDIHVRAVCFINYLNAVEGCTTSPPVKILLPNMVLLRLELLLLQCYSMFHYESNIGGCPMAYVCVTGFKLVCLLLRQKPMSQK